MCTVSMFLGQLTAPQGPNYMPWTPTTPDPALASQLLEVIKRLDEIDKRLGLLDCSVERKKKAAFKAKLKRRAKRK